MEDDLQILWILQQLLWYRGSVGSKSMFVPWGLRAFLCEVCTFSLWMCGFYQGSSTAQTDQGNWWITVLLDCTPPLPCVSWDWLQNGGREGSVNCSLQTNEIPEMFINLTAKTQHTTWMDGWKSVTMFNWYVVSYIYITSVNGIHCCHSMLFSLNISKINK